MPPFHALIRTHHIVSRRKLAILRAVAKDLGCAVMLRTGGVPGLMYVVANDERPVSEWVGKVRWLRYKDFKVLRAPMAVADTASKISSSTGKNVESLSEGGWQWEEVPEVKDFGKHMSEKGLWEWWRDAMGYTKG